ncbi:MAG: hypothetical protein VYE15_05700 [Myxococcota bacterium]|nr:hypothetical protein [Myxococcota bacterium]
MPLGAIALCLVGCVMEPESVSTLAPASSLPEPGTDGWTQLAPTEEVVARVNGIPIGRQALVEALTQRPDLTVEVVLRRLVELEALAQEAHRRGIGEAHEVHAMRQQTLVQRYLKRGFEAKLTPDQIPEVDVQRVYSLPQIRKLYDHADAWQMAHLFITCCDPKVENCDTAEVLECFEMGARAIHVIYDELRPRTEPLGGEPLALVEAMQAYREAEETRFPQLAFRQRAFYYDPNKPHEEQKGYNVLAEVVARTVMDAPLAVPQEPVQSAFGWHILVKLEHTPESRKGPDDPEVAADIRQKLFPKYRGARFTDLLRTLQARHGAQGLDPGQGSRGGQP